MLFWLASFITLAVVAAIMLPLVGQAKAVPDEPEGERPSRFNKDVLRVLAYVLMIVVCLAAAMYEMSLYEDITEEEKRELPTGLRRVKQQDLQRAGS